MACVNGSQSSSSDDGEKWELAALPSTESSGGIIKEKTASLFTSLTGLPPEFRGKVAEGRKGVVPVRPALIDAGPRRCET